MHKSWYYVDLQSELMHDESMSKEKERDAATVIDSNLTYQAAAHERD